MKILTFLLGWALLAVAMPLAADETGSKRHPTYNLMGRDTPSVDSPLNPNFVVAEEARLSESGFWRSSYISEQLVGLVVEDVDLDGRNEIVYAGNNSVTVARFESGKLAQLAQYQPLTTETLASVDALDLNGDGRMEIIVSIQNESYNVASKIFSFTGDSLEPLLEYVPWYLRVVSLGGERVLAGQRAATDRKSVYSGRVMRLELDGSSLVSKGAIALPSQVHLFNFVKGRLGRDGQLMTVAIKFPTEHLFMYEQGEQRAWESKEEYGGTLTTLIPANMGTESIRIREFLPSRLLIDDIDGDGQNELIVAKNDRGGVAFMSGQRDFPSGAINAFRYSNMSLTPFFRTRTLPGPVVDCTLADYNNDGIRDLVAAVVLEHKSGLLKAGRSVIVAYELGAQEPQLPE